MWKTALKYVWVIYATIAFFSVLYTAFVPEDLVKASLPACYSVTHFGRQCFMCGSTRSFIAMGNGKISLAWKFNKIAVMLWMAFAVNSLFLLKHLVFKIKQT